MAGRSFGDIERGRLRSGHNKRACCAQIANPSTSSLQMCFVLLQGGLMRPMGLSEHSMAQRDLTHAVHCERGKVRLSMKAVDQETGKEKVEETAATE